MTDVLPLKRALLDEWLADTQNHVFHTKKRKTNTPVSPSLSLPSLSSPSSVASNEDYCADDRSLLSLPTLAMTNQTASKKTRKVARLDCLERKVDRLLDDNNQLKQCAYVLEWEHQLAMTEAEAKEARIAALEKQLAAAHKLLLLNRENDDDSLLE